MERSLREGSQSEGQVLDMTEAWLARIRPRRQMSAEVSLEVILSREALLALFTLKRAIACVNETMATQVILARETHAAHGAVEALLLAEVAAARGVAVARGVPSDAGRHQQLVWRRVVPIRCSILGLRGDLGMRNASKRFTIDWVRPNDKVPRQLGRAEFRIDSGGQDASSGQAARWYRQQ